MSYYYGRGRRYRGWRYRESKPTVYDKLHSLFGDAINTIKKAFLNFDAETLDEILQDYGALYGESAEKYARNTYHNWKRGATQLSGKTLERLVERCVAGLEDAGLEGAGLAFSSTKPS